MKLKTLLYFILVFCIQSVDAQLFIELYREGYPRSYLFGTMHLLPKNQFKVSTNFKRYLDSSDLLVEELNLDALKGSKKLELAKLTRLPQGKVLRDVLPDSVYRAMAFIFKNELKYSTFKWNALQQLHPLILESLLLQHCVKKPLVPETYFYNYFKKKGKACYGLETPQEQMLLLTSLPVTLQFKEFPKTFSLVQSDYNNLLSMYQKEDLNALYNYSTRFMPDSLNQALLFNRNRTWMQTLRVLLSQKSCFIAVGAAHLAGPQGLIELLKAEGFQIRLRDRE